ncbi:MAG: FdhF/YdeP family oxidoreductase [Bacteroidales bacterium]|jgi:molybdopterin-dependent oxidoreductase alpha subunit
MLSYAEQLLLLTVDPVTGRFFPVANQVVQLSLAGALLFDASFNGLINDDWEQLTVLNRPESGNLALDETIRCLQVLGGSIPLEQAMSVVAAHGETLRHLVWDSMETRGLLVRRKKELLFYAQKLELFTPDFPLVIEVHQKIRNAIFKDEVPDFQVPAMVSLMVAGGLTTYVLKPDEITGKRERIAWLAGMESLGREIIRSVHALESTDLEVNAAEIIGLNHDQPKTFAGGMDSVLTSLSYLYKEAGILRSRKIIASFNQVGGFECPGCAWPNPDKNRSHFEFCESGAKNLSSEATTKHINHAFFEKWSVPDLLLTSDYWLEQQGRLTQPMVLDENATHYKPISWEESFQLIASELNQLFQPDEAVFYASGRTSNEAAFVYQLFARAFGTNNLPNSANLCHEPSGKALTLSLGVGKSSVSLDDFPKAGAIFIFGHNPGSNHPRMLNSLKEAARNGCRIIAVNPMPEASLMGFADPQEVRSYFGQQTALTQLFIQPRINGDMALVRGIVKAALEEEDRTGGILDKVFIEKFTGGFKEYRETVSETTWEEIVAASGVEKSKIIEAASIYWKVDRVIASWCLGITHHRNSVETIREIINLLLLRGNIGKPGSGVCPVRGHSNIQGIRSVGVGENMPVPFLDAMEKHFSIPVPRKPGLSIVPAVRAMAAGKVKVLISLGGNLASAVPDTHFVDQAIRQNRLTVMISTKLNRSHLVTGKRALILPCLSRSEEDVSTSGKQRVSIEDAMGKIGYSGGCLSPSSTGQKSEVSIIAEMARVTLGNKGNIDWNRFGFDNQFIRSEIAETIPTFRELGNKNSAKKGFYLDNALQKRQFKKPDGKGLFSNHPLQMDVPEEGELMLMTIRSHDQFNTSIFGLNDRYRGIHNERRVLFMNTDDMKERGILAEQLVNITSHYDGKVRRLEGYYAIAYPIRQGCVAAYFPEANPLLSINNTSACETPAYKSVRVKVVGA